MSDWRDEVGGYRGLAYRIAKRHHANQLPDCKTAIVAVITGDKPEDYSITLGIGDGTSERWKLSESLLKKIRREINEKLD